MNINGRVQAMAVGAWPRTSEGKLSLDAGQAHPLSATALRTSATAVTAAFSLVSGSGAQPPPVVNCEYAVASTVNRRDPGAGPAVTWSDAQMAKIKG